MRLILVGAVATALALTGCAGTPQAAPSQAALPQAAPSQATPQMEPVAAAKPDEKAVKSNLSRLKKLGITINAGVLIDVADDGKDRFLAVGKNGKVDFTGTGRTDTTMMSLQAAPVAAENRVVIKPPFWNEDLGAGYCVADTKGAPLKLETCETGKATQIFTVVPAGDSGQFELRGKYGILRVDDGKLTTSGKGRTGLQTIKYAQ
ncbi:hypothetical protein [Actinoplanes sp. NBRC 101535]|uniref:hypothetical protein n=1 Tax=Actinoplanes sp. NBRC 101535 TaxID=3032196 RepID=UPI00249FEA75|nr:hypothetical protein [Actinoplanes sp. NBRC 101535]GLY02407.1 hypothetical protein Acsp01_27860 [Actinoplanes sp. NBRC 101535]